MKAEEKLQSILNNLKNKDFYLTPDAFHLRELEPNLSDAASLDEFEEWEFKIGEKTLKISWFLEDMSDDFISIDIDGKTEYCSSSFDCTHHTEYDDDAEDLFLLIMQHGGVLKPQSELDYVESFIALGDNKVLKKRKKRAKKFSCESQGKTASI